MKTDKEVWKDIPGFNGDYKVSNMGNISGVRVKKLKHNIMRNGYPSVKLSRKSKLYSFLPHRLVAQAFIPNPENKPQVNHINGIKTDNRAENLEWCTAKENIAHAHANGLRSFRGENSVRSRTNNTDVKNMRLLHEEGVSYGVLAKYFNMSKTQVSRIIKRECWKNVA